MSLKTVAGTAAAAAIIVMAAVPVAALADMTRAEYQAEKARLDARFEADRKKCRAFGGNARDMCLAEAEGDHKIAVAELEELRLPTSGNRYKVRLARAEANYEIAKQECDERLNALREDCLEEAKATFTSHKSGARTDRR